MVILSLILTGFAVTVTGCVDRTISISSEPAGALVYLNDQEIGRTPCKMQFLYYGTYDVRLIKDGYEPYIGSAETDMPLYDIPGPDFVAEILPIRLHSNTYWHFVLNAASEERADMIENAKELRSYLNDQTN